MYGPLTDQMYPGADDDGRQLLAADCMAAERTLEVVSGQPGQLHKAADVRKTMARTRFQRVLGHAVLLEHYAV